MRLLSVIGMVLILVLANDRSFASAPANVGVDQLSHVRLPSPDRRCTVSTVPTDESKNEDAKLFVRCGKSPRKLLSHYFRTGVVRWSPDSCMVIFVDEHSVEEYTLKLFRIDDPGTSNATLVDRAIVKSAESQLRGNEVVFYYVNFVRFVGVSHMIVDADVIFIRKGQTGPAQETVFRFDVDLNTFRVNALRESPVH